jgi:nitronate monooxygenase
MLRTRFTEMFDLAYPVMSAPMAMHSGGNLAGAVSAEGGLGSFGGIHVSGDPEWIRTEVAKVRARTDRPFGIGFISDFIPFAEPLFEATLAERPALVALSFGDPRPWVERCRGAGIPVMCQVQTRAHADLAVEAGADLLVAQGTEAGGHTGRESLLPLLAGVAERHPSVPLLASGGIGDGRTLAAALAAGADGAWMGTAFLATPEALEIDDEYKALIVQSDGTDTVLTSAYDIVSGYPWPDGISERVRRNRFTDEWVDREFELRQRREEIAAARKEGPDTREVIYGQSARFVTAIRPAATVVRSVCEEAERQLRSRPGSLLA